MKYFKQLPEYTNKLRVTQLKSMKYFGNAIPSLSTKCEAIKTKMKFKPLKMR